MSSNKSERDRKRWEKAQRAKKAIDLRIKGYELEEIAPEIGMQTRSGVKRIIDRTIERFPAESVATLRDLQYRRLQKMVKAIWKKVEAGDLDAMDRILKIETRIAALFGLDATEKQELTLKTDSTPAAARSVMKELFGDTSKRDKSQADDDAAPEGTSGE